MRFDHPDGESAAESVADSGVDATERDRRGLLDVLIESSPVGLAWLDRELRYLRVNAALAELDGVTAEEHLGRTPEEVAPDLAPLLCEQMRHVVETGEPVIGFEVTGSAPAAPGVAQKRLASYYPIRGDGGATIGIGAVVTDITAGRASDRQRRLSELRYKMLADSVPQIVWTAGPDGAIDYYNDRWFEYSGLSREDPDAWDWERGLHPDDVAASRANWRASVETRREHTNEARFRRHDGQYRWFCAVRGRCSGTTARSRRGSARVSTSTSGSARKRSSGFCQMPASFSVHLSTMKLRSTPWRGSPCPRSLIGARSM